MGIFGRRKNKQQVADGTDASRSEAKREQAGNGSVVTTAGDATGTVTPTGNVVGTVANGGNAGGSGTVVQPVATAGGNAGGIGGAATQVNTGQVGSASTGAVTQPNSAVTGTVGGAAGTGAVTGVAGAGGVTPVATAGNAAGTGAEYSMTDVSSGKEGLAESASGNGADTGSVNGLAAEVLPTNQEVLKNGFNDSDINVLNDRLAGKARVANAKSISDLPDIGDVKKADELEQSYVKEHPWVIGGDLGNKYAEASSKKGTEIIRDINTYRAMTGQAPLTTEEKLDIIQNHNPFKSLKEEKKEQRRQAWRERIDAIGDFVNHFVNFGRAMGGNPIAQVQNNYNSERYDRLRQADQAFRNQQFTNYITQVQQQQRRQDELDKETRAYEHALELARLKQNSPETSYKVLAAKLGLQKAELDAAMKKLQFDNEKELHQMKLETEKVKQKTAATKSKSKGKKKDDPDKDGLYEVDGHRFKSREYAEDYVESKYPGEKDLDKHIVVH